MDDQKRILVFSDAGGTGRSYHAELSAQEPAAARPLSAGTRLEGRCRDPGPRAHATAPTRRSRRCSGRSRPTSRPRSASSRTIARRLDTLGAITRGQRQTGGQGLFRPEDNLESHYARDALAPALSAARRAARSRAARCSAFEEATGLKLMDANGIKDELAADHHLPQPAAGADHRAAGHPVHGLRAAPQRPHRGRHRRRHLRHRAWRRCGPRASSSPIGRRSTPIPAPARRHVC